MDADIINSLLESECTLVVKDSVTSTNDEVVRLLRESEQSSLTKPMLVISSEQTAGRGRLGRSWVSPQGGLYISLALQPQATLQQITTLPLILALALRRTLQGFSEVKVHIKWPNDLLTDNGKICGILVETSSLLAAGAGTQMESQPTVIAGIGINVFRPEGGDRQDAEASNGIAWLADESDSKLSLEQVAASVINEVLGSLDSWKLAGFDFLVFQEEYQRELILMGKEVMVSDIYATPLAQGIVTGIDTHGRLLLQDAGVAFAITAGDVTLRNP